MSAERPHAKLQRAMDLSQAILRAAENADAGALSGLDDERALLLKSFRLEALDIVAADRAALQEIVRLNDLALGLMVHHRRTKSRELDMAAVGRRAVAAYAQHVTQQR